MRDKAMNDAERLSTAGRSPCASVYLVHAEGSPLEKTLDACTRIARRHVHVVIEGERGTGKETLARLVHELSRATGPFVPIGDDAFTGADQRFLAGIPDDATVYVEDVGQLAPSIQASLVHHMKRDGRGCRVVASTTRAPSAEVEAGRLRGDLLDLLACSVPVPPLRTRPEDVVPVLRAACEEIASGIRIDTDATERLAGASWPGNIGELRSLATRLCVFANDDVVTRADVERCSMQRRTLLRPALAAAVAVQQGGARK
jgi:two-component system NtrC family response regulator